LIDFPVRAESSEEEDKEEMFEEPIEQENDYKMADQASGSRTTLQTTTVILTPENIQEIINTVVTAAVTNAPQVQQENQEAVLI
jgi:predicted house-cleaning NTP pyrophosphatase (Maf/HAM1 superfamily)